MRHLRESIRYSSTSETRRLRCGAGLSLVEVMVFLAILSVAMLGTLSIYARHVMGGRLTEQRRLATLAAEEKLDEIRNAISTAVSSGSTDPLTYVYYHSSPNDGQFYGPTPATSALSRPCCFTVANLPAITGISVGTITIITDETPNEAQFGLAYDGTSAPPIFGVDLNGNRKYNETALTPFPLDLNNNGAASDHVVVDHFAMLPVVVTIQWLGPYGKERIDVFSILTVDQAN